MLQLSASKQSLSFIAPEDKQLTCFKCFLFVITCFIQTFVWLSDLLLLSSKMAATLFLLANVIVVH